MLFLVMVHVKNIGVILSHWDYWGLYHYNNESCWGSIGIIGDNIIAKNNESGWGRIEEIIPPDRNIERFLRWGLVRPMTFMI